MQWARVEMKPICKSAFEEPKYCLAAAMCTLVGACIYWHTWLIANVMFGFMRETYWSAPTTLHNLFGSSRRDRWKRLNLSFEAGESTGLNPTMSTFTSKSVMHSVWQINFKPRMGRFQPRELQTKEGRRDVHRENIWATSWSRSCVNIKYLVPPPIDTNIRGFLAIITPSCFHIVA